MTRARRTLIALSIGLVSLGALSQCSRGPDVPAGSTLSITIEGEYAESDVHPLLARVFGGPKHSLLSLYSALRKAELDPRIARVVLRVRDLEGGWGRAQEIRAAIERVRKAGKPTTAVLEVEGLGSGAYFVASGAERVVANPASRSPLLGFAAEPLFLAGLFEKVGVMVEYERAGDYKSAVEMFANEKMSDANREMTNAILDSTEESFLAGVAKARGIEPKALRALIDAAPGSPKELLDAKLVDQVAYYEDVVKDAHVVEADDYEGVSVESLGVKPVAKIALVQGVGTVRTGESSLSPGGESSLGSDTIVEAIHDAVEDDEIRAILFRVDSPGGSPLAADQIWRAVKDARAAGKPVIASFGDVAASGGYYVACGADTIVAQPTTLTGSIGVFVIRPSLGGLLEKLGIGVERLQRGARADVLFGSQPLSPGARAFLQEDVQGVYEQFVARVAEGRKMAPDAVKKVGGGRVWTGAQAREIGLVDELGGLYEAALAAKEALGLEPTATVALVPYPQPPSLTQQVGELLRGAHARAVDPLDPLLPRELRQLRQVLGELPLGAPVLIPPSLLVVH
jgi:protease-4